MTLDITGVTAGNTIHSAHVTQFYNLLVGSMLDQPVTLKNLLSVTRQAAASPPTKNYLQVVGVADTLVDAEATDVYFNLNRTVQFLGGSVPTTQRAFRVDAPVYDANLTGQTITNAATMTVAGAPTAGSGNLTITNAYSFWVQGGTIRLDGPLQIAPAASTGSPPTAIKVTIPAHGNLTASAEWAAFDVVATGALQWATGNLTLERWARIRTPTASFVGASTITDAATINIDGCPQAGTNATITHAWGLRAQDGALFLGTAGQNGATDPPLVVQSVSGAAPQLISFRGNAGGEVGKVDATGTFTALALDFAGATGTYQISDGTHSVKLFQGAAGVWETGGAGTGAANGALRVQGGFVRVDSTDPGAGVASTVTYTGTEVATAAGTVTGFPAPGAGAAAIVAYIKVYHGTTLGYIPIIA